MVRGLLAGGLLALTLAEGAAAERLTVFAAASLKGPLDEVAEEAGDVVISYGGSGNVARQIAQGAPADVVLLANSRWMQMLVDEGLVQDPVDILSNNVVLVQSAETAEPLPLTPEAVSAALGEGPLAIGLTESVPAGIYGRAGLETLGLWETVEGKLAETEDVRAALALVARREAPLGLVYATDAVLEPDVEIVAKLPADSHPPIRYTGAIVSDNDRAQDFLDLVSGHPAFAEAGFLPPLDE